MLAWKKLNGRNTKVQILEFIPHAYASIGNEYQIRCYVRYKVIGKPYIYNSQFEDNTLFKVLYLPPAQKTELINSAKRQGINSTAKFSGKFIIC